MTQETVPIMPTNYFRLENGQIIKSINELPGALEQMDSQVFLVHVNAGRNDFANWVRDVFKKPDLSEYIRTAKSKEDMVRVLYAYLNHPNIKNPPTSTIVKKVTEPAKADNLRSQDTDKSSLHTAAPESQVPQEHVEKTRVNSPEAAQIKSQAAAVSSKQEKTEEHPRITVNTPASNVHESEADRYFKDHPIIIEQIVDAKRKDFAYDPLLPVDFNSNANVPIKVDMLKASYIKAYERLVLMRKNGFDTSLCEAMLFRIPTKIKVYEATKEEKDAAIIRRYLNEAIEELNNSKG